MLAVSWIHQIPAFAGEWLPLLFAFCMIAIVYLLWRTLQVMPRVKPTGVNERLVRKVRDVLDRDGFEQVKIVVSGGFTIDKIREFEQKQVPVDAYGVGSSLIRGSNDFTADIVLTDGRPSAKVGRSYKPNRRLAPVE